MKATMSDETAGMVVTHPDLEGQHDHTIDDKGRVSIPAEFRAALGLQDGDEVVVTRHLRERCLRVYRPDAWEQFKARIADMPGPAGAALRKVVRGSARRMKVDRLGRISLPTALRTYAQLDGKCFVMGQGLCMEVWDEGEWNRAHAPENYGELDEDALSALDM
jgi:MraZ protein